MVQFPTRFSGFFSGMRLRTKFILFCSVTIIGIVSVLSAYFVSFQRDLLHREMSRRGAALVKYFARSCSYPLLVEDLDSIRQMATSLMGEDDVEVVRVLASDGRILLEEAKAGRSLHPGVWTRTVSVGEVETVRLFENDRLLLLTIPIDNPHDDLSGWGEGTGRKSKDGAQGEAVLGMSLERTRQMVASSILTTLVITAGIGILGLFWAVWAVSYFVDPLKAILVGTCEIANGRLSYRVRVNRSDELGALAGSFNDMAERLENNNRALDEYSSDLERKVETRTEELCRREAEFSSILENNPVGIVLVDAETDIVTWANSNALKILRGARDEIVGLPSGRFSFPDGENAAVSIVRVDGATTESLLRGVAGVEIPVLKSSCPISCFGTNHRLYAFFDITEYKRLESELLQAQKMGAVGTLAGGIAHDFNNLLQTILGSIQLLILKGTPSDEDCKYLHQVEESVNRGTELVKRLLTFSRKVESRLRLSDLNTEVEKTISLLERTLPKMIVIESELCPSISSVRIDPMQIEQMIMNLALNARDSMPNGGRLVLKTSMAVFDEEVVRRATGQEPGKYVCLSVSDTGTGMSEDVVDRIFEPFFTTKEVGKGTGLGLSMVYGIVKGHGGHIVCRSKKGEGTCFDIFGEGTADSCFAENGWESADSPVCGMRTILMVDDDKSILELGTEMLEGLGYRVLVAEGGEQALEVFHKELSNIGLVLLDLEMPGIGGLECLKRLREMESQVPVVVVSGYVDFKEKDDLLNAGAAALLGKPFRLSELSRLIGGLFRQG